MYNEAVRVINSQKFLNANLFVVGALMMSMSWWKYVKMRWIFGSFDCALRIENAWRFGFWLLGRALNWPWNTFSIDKLECHQLRMNREEKKPSVTHNHKSTKYVASTANSINGVYLMPKHHYVMWSRGFDTDELEPFVDGNPYLFT